MEPQPNPSPTVVQTISTPQVQYAGFWARLLATLIDGCIVGLVSGIINLISSVVRDIITGLSSTGSSSMVIIASAVGSLVIMLLGVGYYIYMIGCYGQTLGKMAMKIKVQREDGQPNVGYGTAFLREIIGKIVSSIILDLGFLWMIWDSKKQTWHDKIAHTVVVKV